MKHIEGCSHEPTLLLHSGRRAVAAAPTSPVQVEQTAMGKVDEYIATPAATVSPEGMSMAYGPLLSAMRGKKWVLAPHCMENTASGVKVNLFEVPGGYALPVGFGGKLESASVQVRNIPSLDKLKAEAIHPGAGHPLPVRTQFKDGILELTVPLKRGCAMVRLILPK